MRFHFVDKTLTDTKEEKAQTSFYRGRKNTNYFLQHAGFLWKLS